MITQPRARIVRLDGMKAAAERSARWTPHPGARWLSPLLIACFVGSGFAALVYEIVWFQLLEYVLGSSAISVGILLASYMGGLCLGSMLSPRLARLTRANPMRTYGLLEIGIGLLGLSILFGMPLV